MAARTAELKGIALPSMKAVKVQSFNTSVQPNDLQIPSAFVPQAQALTAEVRRGEGAF